MFVWRDGEIVERKVNKERQIGDIDASCEEVLQRMSYATQMTCKVIATNEVE